MDKSGNPISRLPVEVKETAIRCSDLGPYFALSEDIFWRYPDVLAAIDHLIESGHYVFSMETTALKDGKALDFAGHWSHKLKTSTITEAIRVEAGQKLKSIIERHFRKDSVIQFDFLCSEDEEILEFLGWTFVS